MTQQDRSSDGDLENEPTLVGKPQRGKRTPLESGPAPRGTAEDIEIEVDLDDVDASEDPALEGWENSALYQRLLHNGALDEVMEVAARERVERPGEPEDLEAEVGTRGPVSEVVPKGPRAGAAPAPADAVDDAEDDRQTLETLEPDSTPRPLPLNAPTPELPSMMLGADASSRADSTQRVVLRKASDEAAEPSPTERAPSLAAGRSEQPASKPLLFLLALLFVAAGVLGFYLWTGYAGRQQAAEAPARPGAATPSASPVVVSSQAGARAGAVEPDEAEPASDEPAPEPEVSATAAGADERRRVGEPERTRRRRAETEQDGPAAEEARAESEPAQPGLPEQPGRENVVEVMTGMRSAFETCVGDARGDVRLVMSVGGDGEVVHAVVRGDFEGAPAGSCLARKARQARFEPFAQRRLRVVYPLRF